MTAQATDDDYEITVAIDFGTTYSGYAFSETENPHEVIMNDDWGGGMGTLTFKTPTAVLTNRQKQFVSFGYMARNDYKGKNERRQDDAKLYIYDEGFKMKLYRAKDPLTVSVDSRDGKQTIKLCELISMTLKYLYKHFLEKLNKTYPWIGELEVKVILTVPAIWETTETEFMLTMAEKAGIFRKNVVCVKEPEAASLYCRTLAQEDVLSTSDPSLPLPVGAVYLVIDSGGGTVDAAYNRASDTSSEGTVFPTKGEPSGGNGVNEKFETLLDEIIGKEFMRKYKILYPEGWFRIYTEFEFVKREYSSKQKKHVIEFPETIMDVYRKSGFLSLMKRNIEKKIKKSKREGIKFEGSKLILEPKVFKDLFPDTIDKIISFVDNLLQCGPLCELKYIFLVGGFANCELLFKRLESADAIMNNDVHVIRPLDAPTAVLRGAVQYRQDRGDDFDM